MDAKKKKQKKIMNAVLIAAIVILAAVLVKVLAFTPDKKTAQKEENLKQAMTTETHEEQTEGSETFAIFGVDSRTNQLGKGTRSDSLMVVNVNHETKKIKVASVFRDCYVNIKGHGLDKITHAHSFGGPELALDTLNQNFDLDLENYITVNFGNVVEVIDDLGGIELDIQEDELSSMNSSICELNKVNETNSSEITETGIQKVNGTQAVAYSRVRHAAGGDYKRAERQRTVLMKIFEKAKTKKSTELFEIANQMMDNISTSYSSGEVLDLLAYLSQYQMEETKGFPRKLWGGMIGKVWYGVPVTLESMSSDLHEYLFDDKDYKPSEKVQEISDEIKQYASTPNEDLDSE